MHRRFAILLGCLLLPACAQDSFVTSTDEKPVGRWLISQTTDKVTGGTLPSASTFAEASNSNSTFSKGSSLQLTCFAGKPMARIAFDFRVGAPDDVELGYRFDDKPGVAQVPIRVLPGRQMLVIDEPQAIASLARDMQHASKLYVQLRSITHGRTSVTYDISGAGAAVTAAFSSCGALPVQPRSNNRS